MISTASAGGSPDASVLICTFNRAELLGETLDTLARSLVGPGLTWETIVVDNNSTDSTRRVVQERTPRFPVPLRYVFEPRQGKSYALNTGMAASSARVIAFTDDDVRVPPEWLETAVRPLLDRTDIEYTGGPVRPIWDAPKPAWLDEGGNLGGTLAVKDHGPASFIFEDAAKSPLGVNMAVRRTLIERIGGFRPDLGRRGGSLLGQEQADFFYRSRAVRARGLYVPGMVVEHHVPRERLTRRYFRRWWFWKGISHARVHAIHEETELGIDLRRVPHVLGVPRYMYGGVARHLIGWARALARRDSRERVEHAMMVFYFAGYLRERRRPRSPSALSPAPDIAARAELPMSTASRPAVAPPGTGRDERG
jgi:glycosyltransferase involved in cell wall biosynthesis